MDARCFRLSKPFQAAFAHTTTRLTVKECDNGGMADIGIKCVQAKQYRESQRLGLLSQEDFVLDTSALSKRKADMAGVAAWPEDNEGPSDVDFDADAPSQVTSPAGCSMYCAS